MNPAYVTNDASSTTVSVPLRGKDSHEQVTGPLAVLTDVQFPSPCGEKIVMNIFEEIDDELLWGKVSVPLRGKDSHERLTDKYPHLTFLYVSVPLRGKDSHERSIWHRSDLSSAQFPSPCGEKIVMNLRRRGSCAGHH